MGSYQVNFKNRTVLPDIPHKVLLLLIKSGRNLFLLRNRYEHTKQQFYS
jgi:hypothetical protein